MTRRRQKVPIFVSIFLPEELISFVGLTVVIPNLPGKLKFLLFLKKKILWKTPLWHCPEEVWLFVSYPSALKAPSSFFAISPFSSQTYFLFNQIITVFKYLLTWFARILGPVSEVSRPLAETNSRQAKALIGSIGI